MSDESSKPALGFSVERLNAFTDGVLAIVITILVLGIDIPEDHRFSEQGLIAFLVKISRDVATYAASFLLIGAYWVQHHAIFNFLGRCNRIVIWLNILFMFPLTLAPFLTKVKATYRHDVLVVPLFGSAFILAGLALMVIWHYVVSHPELLKNPPINPAVVHSIQQRILMGPLVSLVAVGLSFISIDLGTIAFGSLPLFYLSHRMADKEDEQPPRSLA